MTATADIDESTPEWDSLLLPNNMGMMGPGVSVQLHFCRFTDDWTLYIIAMPAVQMSPMGPQETKRYRWSATFKGMEVVSGALTNLEKAQRLALRCLRAVIEFEDDIPDDEDDGSGILPPGAIPMSGGH